MKNLISVFEEERVTIVKDDENVETAWGRRMSLLPVR